jgi:Fic family protein
LSSPLLYLSAYFERDRQRYYDELLAVSVSCDWERWLRYFLTGVLRESRDVQVRIRHIRSLQDSYRELLEDRREAISSLRLVEQLFANPIITVRGAANVLGMSIAGARRVLNRLESAGLVRHDSQTWPPLYIADDILDALQASIDLPQV